jgi:hypothetical protein
MPNGAGGRPAAWRAQVLLEMAKTGKYYPSGAYLSGKAMDLRRACTMFKMCTTAAATTEADIMAVYFNALPAEDSAYTFAAGRPANGDHVTGVQQRTDAAARAFGWLGLL